MTKPVVLILGASSGIGRAAALHLALNGSRVVLAARRMDRLNELAAEIQENQGECLVVQTDISQAEQITSLVERCLEAYGRVDVLINSAGYGKLVWLEEQSLEEIDHQIQTNLTGAIQLIRSVLPVMQSQGSGQIIQVASIASWIGIPTYSLYAANKFGLRGFLESLRRELRGSGITVTGFYPGSVDTEFDQHAGIEWRFRRVTPDWLMVSPEQVARRIQRVISRRSSFSVMPWYMLIPVVANALSPSLVGWILSRNFYRSGGTTVAWGKRPQD
jgi:short-subunit dehydrogenase